MAKQEITDELPELDKTEKDEEGFDLLPEGAEYVAKVDFKSILFRQYDRTARAATLGEPLAFSNGVMTLKSLCSPYYDKQFKDAIEAIEGDHKQAIARLSEESDGEAGNPELVNYFLSEKLTAIFEEIGLLMKRKNIIK